jgi:predicted DNA-binding protein
MLNETNLSTLIDEYVRALLREDKGLIEQSLKNLHKYESKIEPEIIQPFLDLSKNQSPYVREAAIKGLGEFGDYSVASVLYGFLKDSNSRVRQAAIHSLAEIRDLSEIDSVIVLLNDINPFVREEAANTLGLLGCSNAIEHLLNALNDENIHVQVAVITALGLLGDIRATHPLLAKLKSSCDGKIKKTVIQAIGDIGCKYTLEFLYLAVENVDVPIELGISEVVQKSEVNIIVTALVEALQDNSPKIRIAAQAALNKIRSQCAAEILPKEIVDPEVSAADVNKNDHGSYVVSKSGVPVWKSPEMHPLLGLTTINHPDFLRKAAETFPKGAARGYPRICSKNSEDARTWLAFSPLLYSSELREVVLTNLLKQAFPELIAPDIFQKLAAAQLHFWHGRFTPNLQLVPPPTLPFKQGLTETDIIITIENEVVLYLQAKLHSGSSPLVKNQPDWDQVIRTLDVGSWYAQGRFSSSYFVFLQYGEDNTNTESMVLKYKDNPIATKNALAHRCDLDEKQKELLSRSMAFIRWPDPFDGIN